MTPAASHISSAERMLNLVALLTESSSPLTLEQIADRMGSQYAGNKEARRTTFERDKRTLRELGVPITTQTLGGSDAGRTAYSIDRSSYQKVDFGLTESEMAALQEAAALVQIGTSWGKQAVRWLGGEVVEPVTAEAARVSAQEPVLPLLWTAVAESREAMFGYHGKQRRVRPYGLLARSGFWYLIAHDVDRDAQVAYRVDRIDGGVTVGEPGQFVRPDGFSMDTAYQRDPKVFPGGDAELAIVRVDHRVAPTVLRELGDDAIVADHPDGSVDVRVPCGNRIAFRSWLFAMVDRAEVISPESVRHEVVALLEAMEAGNP